MHKLWSFIKNKGGIIIHYLPPVMRCDKRQAVLSMQTMFHGSRHSNTFSNLVLIPLFLPSTLSKGKMTAHNWFHSSRKKSEKNQTAIHFRRSSRWLQRISPRGTRWKKSSWLRLQRSRPGMLRALRSMSVMLNSFITHTTQWSTWSVDHWTGSGKDGWNCKSPHHTLQGYYIITSIRAKAQHQEAELLRPNLPGKLVTALKMVMEWCGLWGDRKGERIIFFRESFYIRSTPDISQTQKRECFSSTGL